MAMTGTQLAKELAKTGTGADKLRICEGCSQAEDAIAKLNDANFFASARKARAIVGEPAGQAPPADDQTKAPGGKQPEPSAPTQTESVGEPAGQAPDTDDDSTKDTQPASGKSAKGKR